MTNPMVAQIESLPALIRGAAPVYAENITRTLSRKFCRSIRRIYLTGCGDSHHASIGSELAFEQLAGLTTEAQTSLQFARYTVDTLQDPAHCLVVGASVSGEVSRTLEGMLLARKAGAKVLALTATPACRIAARLTWWWIPPSRLLQIRPVWAFQASLITLPTRWECCWTAVHLGEMRGHLSTGEAVRLASGDLRINPMPPPSFTLEKNLSLAKSTASELARCRRVCLLRSGRTRPLALSHRQSVGSLRRPGCSQDMRNGPSAVFRRQANTPTFIITAADREPVARGEIITAAVRLAGGWAVVAPLAALLSLTRGRRSFFRSRMGVVRCLRRSFPPSRPACSQPFALSLGEPYFRNFGGGEG